MSGATIVRYPICGVLLGSVLLAGSARSETILSVTQYDYDANARLECATVRMNPSNYGGLPPSACDFVAPGSYGPDRITRMVYSAAGQVKEIRKAVGTSLQQTYANIFYTPNGKTDWVEDANGNRSDYAYDALDRLVQINFPSTTVGAHLANVSDFELYGYDDNGNRISVRRRSGETITYSYDALNRETLKNLPGAGEDVYSAYDAFGRRLYAHVGSGTGGQGIDYAYDGLGRPISETSYGRTLAYKYDLANNRTRVTWPGNDFYVDYTYDAANRMNQVQENGATNGAALLATYSYDALGRRKGIARGDGTSGSYGYDGISRLSSLTQDLAGTDNDQTFSFGYFPSHQTASRRITNTAYSYAAPSLSQSYTRNGLNQYSAVAGVNFTYDPRGNLTSDGTRSFNYDLENRLTSVSGPATLSLSYDPLGRLRQTTASSTTTFLYDGDRLSAEYNSSGSLLRRYVHGANRDEPLVWYEGSGTTDRRYLIGDHLGSIIANSGSSTTRYTYGPFGEPNAWSGSRFRYSGQIVLPEAQLYHYKARVYDPKLGRFLQTDPMGYEDDYNLYAYVKNDPLNRIDPTGLAGCDKSLADKCDEVLKNQQQALDLVRKARADLAQLRNERKGVKDGKQSELSEGAKSTEQRMNDYFKNSGDKTLGKVDKMLGNVEKVLADDGRHWNYHSAPSALAANGKSEIAWSSYGSSKIRLTPEYFNTNGYGVKTLLHEPTHIFGANLFSDETYGEVALRKLTTERALDNADSYSFYTDY